MLWKVEEKHSAQCPTCSDPNELSENIPALKFYATVKQTFI